MPWSSSLLPTLESPRRFLRGLLLAAVLLPAPSCGTFFYNRAWERFEPTGTGGALEGRWEGGWRSEWNGHSGGLRGLMTHEGGDAYLASFHSTYARVLFFRHETLFRVTEESDGTQRFEGAQDLGQLVGGVYRYEGRVAGDAFEAHFEADNGDHGIFEMRRVGNP